MTTSSQRLVLSLGQLRQHLGIDFVSGSEKTEMTQNSGALSYQHAFGTGILKAIEVNAYLADTPSRDLADKSYAFDSATLYELWNDPRRVAGARDTGLQGRLVFTPLPGSTFKFGAGSERLEYDFLGGKQSTSRATGSAEWTQLLAGGYRFRAGADVAAQNRFTFGMERPFGDSGQFGANLTAIRGRDGAPDDNRITLSWRYAFGGRRSPAGNADISARNTAPAWGSLLDQVAQRPGFLPAQAVAKLDTSAAPVRLIGVNKAALPAGASVNTATGVVSAPIAVAVADIAGITLNGAPFTNNGAFALSGANLSIDPNKITQPTVGAHDTYVVTLNNSGGGTTLVTVVVSHGSVQIDSITTADGDITAPLTSVAPALSGTTDTATTLKVTLNENGTGYLLLQPAAAAAPTRAAVQAGTAFAMSANVASAKTISGLTPSTAYTLYFIAKDAANNVQPAVQSVALTTLATLQAAADSSSTPFNTAKSEIDVLANDKNNSGAAFALSGVLSNPVGGTFTVNAGKIDFTPEQGFSGAASVSYEIADSANNTATGVLTVTVGGDPSVPVAVADSAATPFNTAKTGIDVLAADTNVGGAAPTLSGVLSNQVGGVFTVNAGKIDFTPTSGFSGAASVSYEIADADGSNNKATGVLTVTAYVPPAPTDSATTIGVPTLESKSTTTINLTPVCTDPDGVQNVAVEMYNAAQTVLLATAANGDFSGLPSGTTRSFKTICDRKNGANGAWEPIASGFVDIATDIPPVSFLNIADPATVLNGQTKTLTFTVANLSQNYVDAAAANTAMFNGISIITNNGAVFLDTGTLNITDFATGTFTIDYTGTAGVGNIATNSYRFCLGTVCVNVDLSTALF